MAINEKMNERIREALSGQKKVEEKKMFRGLTFMVNGKMCISVNDEDLLFRIDPVLHDDLIHIKGCRSMEMKGKPYKGYVFVDVDQLKTKKQLDYWIELALDFNKRAKASRK
jgi:TfoX/Sxy family transcriptional regulator of competence genes